MDIEVFLLSKDTTKKIYASPMQKISALRKELDAVFKPDDVARILQALVLMIELHIDQAARPDGTVYIEHPLTVASKVLEAMTQKDADIIIAALLHDAVEDQAYRLVHKGFQGNRKEGKEEELALEVIASITQSPRIKNIIAHLTNPNFEEVLAKKGITLAENKTERLAYISARNQLYAEHVRTIIKDADVALIKLFDFAENALTIDAVIDDTKKDSYRRKYLPVMQIMLDRLKDMTHPLNISPEKWEELVTRFSEAQQKMM